MMTSEIHFDGEHANAKLAKQLFLHDQKKKENKWLVCADLETNIDTKALGKFLKASNLRAADEDSLAKLLNGKKGMVNYFSLVNDTEKKVNVILDKVLFEGGWASFHPMDNTASTCIN